MDHTTTVASPSILTGPAADDSVSALPATLVGHTLVVVDARYGVSKALRFGKPLRLRFGKNGVADVTYPCAGNSGPFTVVDGKIAFELPGIAAEGCDAMLDPKMEFFIIASILDPRAIITNRKNGILVTFDGLRIDVDLSANDPVEDTPLPPFTVTIAEQTTSTIKRIN